LISVDFDYFADFRECDRLDASKDVSGFIQRGTQRGWSKNGKYHLVEIQFCVELYTAFRDVCNRREEISAAVDHAPKTLYF
jgi:hypothetical protein